MKSTVKKSSRYTTKDGYAYLTKRILVAKAKSAGKVAAQNAMEVMGYVVTVKDGWLVKQYKDGQLTKLSEI